MPRFLLINWRDIRNPLAGGAEVHLHEVAKRLVRDGYPCVQVSHAFTGGPSEEWVDGVRIVRRGGAHTFNFTVWRHLSAWCREFDADAVLDDSNKIAFLAPWLTRLPVVLQLHHLFGRVLFRETSWPFAAYVLCFEKLMPRAYRGIRTLTGSASSREELLSKGFAPVDLAPEGVNIEDYRMDAPPARDPHLIAYIGRVKRYKGLDVLLSALRRLLPEFPEARLTIAGTGDDIDRLKALAAEQGLENRVRFAGFISHAEKVALYHQAAVAVNSSLKEGFGLTSIEANACGTPVVATRVPGLVDSVVDGETGFLVPFGDDAAFAEALRRILRGEGRAMEARSRAFAAAQDWERAYVSTRDALLAAYAEGPRGKAAA